MGSSILAAVMDWANRRVLAWRVSINLRPISASRPFTKLLRATVHPRSSIGVEELFRGTLTQTSVYPREVVKRALHHNAGGVILAHNHPSGGGRTEQR